MDESNEGAAAVRSKYITDQTKLAWIISIYPLDVMLGCFAQRKRRRGAKEMDKE